MDQIVGEPVSVLDHGFIRLVDYMGDESSIVQAARVSYGLGTDTPARDAALIRYLLRNHHTSPFEMCEVKLHVKLPIFVARQWIRHRTASVNEVSGRYTALPTEFYVPAEEQVAKQAKDNKQGRGVSVDFDSTNYIKKTMQEDAEAAFARYNEYLTVFDLAKELARNNLPLSTYTEFYWKIDLHNLMHFLRLRTDPHAQYEIRAYADVMQWMVAGWMPNLHKAFVDYRLRSHTFSGPEMDVLEKYLSSQTPMELPDVPGNSERENKVFREAFSRFE